MYKLFFHHFGSYGDHQGLWASLSSAKPGTQVDHEQSIVGSKELNENEACHEAEVQPERYMWWSIRGMLPWPMRNMLPSESEAGCELQDTPEQATSTLWRVASRPTIPFASELLHARAVFQEKHQ